MQQRRQRVNQEETTTVIENGALTGDTEVFTSQGKMTINRMFKDSYAASKVYCRNDSGDLVIRAFSKVYHTGKKPIVKLTLDNGMTLKCTEDQKIYTKNRGEVMAKDLTSEDDIITTDDYKSK